MKYLLLILFFVSFSGLAREECKLIDQYFFAYTKNRQKYIEVCVHQDIFRYTSKQEGEPELTITQPLRDVELNKVLNGYELIVKENNTLFAIMDNDARASLLTIKRQRSIVFFTDLDHDDQFISRLYALDLMISQLKEEEEADMDV